jgi:hypothetical protein
MMYPLLARSVRAQDRARQRLLSRPRLGSGEGAIPPETEVEAGVGRGGRDSSRDRDRVRGSGEAETSSRGRSLRSRLSRKPPPEAGA